MTITVCNRVRSFLEHGRGEVCVTTGVLLQVVAAHESFGTDGTGKPFLTCKQKRMDLLQLMYVSEGHHYQKSVPVSMNQHETIETETETNLERHRGREIHMCAHVYAYAQTHGLANKHKHTHAHSQMHTHTVIHTHTHNTHPCHASSYSDFISM